MEKKEDSNLIISQYVLAVKEIKNAIIDSRYRAARFVNKEMLELNYSIGRFISENSRNAQWGSNAIAVISKMLQQELPGLRGYSEASIKMMRIFGNPSDLCMMTGILEEQHHHLVLFSAK